MALATTFSINFASEEIRDNFEEEFKKFTSDNELMTKIDAVDSIEEIYEVCKDKISYSLEEYRTIMDHLEEHIKTQFMDDQDEELSDDDLEEVVGGSWKKFWKRIGKIAAVAGIVVGVVAAGVAIGATGGAAAAVVGAAVAGQFAAGAAAGAAATTIAVGAGAGAAAGGFLGIAGLVGLS